MSLWKAIRDAAESEDDPFIAAKGLVDSLDKDMLIALIADEIKRYQRTNARHIERMVFARRLAAVNPSSVALSAASTSARPQRVRVPETFRQLFDVKFATYTGDKVLWGEATVFQHMQRIKELTKAHQGLGLTIERHRKAIELIQAAGVTCLQEISEAA